MKILGLIATLGVGAGLAYLFDPDQGRRRRAMLRDKAVAATNSMNETVDGKLRHLSNRVRGLATEARGAAGRERRTSEAGQTSG
jgi:hypothetical protein